MLIECRLLYGSIVAEIEVNIQGTCSVQYFTLW